MTIGFDLDNHVDALDEGRWGDVHDEFIKALKIAKEYSRTKYIRKGNSTLTVANWHFYKDEECNSYVVNVSLERSVWQSLLKMLRIEDPLEGYSDLYYIGQEPKIVFHTEGANDEILYINMKIQCRNGMKQIDILKELDIEEGTEQVRDIVQIVDYILS